MSSGFTLTVYHHCSRRPAAC